MANDTWYVLGAIGLLFLCTLITRASYLLLGDLLPLPEGLRRAFRYAPVAALVAIIVPDVLPWAAGAAPQIDARLPALVVAAWVMWRTRSALLTIGVGMVVLLGLRWLFG